MEQKMKKTELMPQRDTLETYLNLMRKEMLLKDYRISPEHMERPVQHLSYDSQDIREGTLFLCKGAHFKPCYLETAIKEGAFCYLSEHPYGQESGGQIVSAADYILVKDIRLAMAALANLFYREPWRELHLVGITGTKGKSTTTYFIRQILDTYLRRRGKPLSAVVSGIDTYDGVMNFESHLTTPESLMLLRHFRNAADSGIEHLTMEVSSQALKYHRVRGICFEYGCFLNIGEDHISEQEHRDFDDYFESKLQLFSQTKKAVINLNSNHIDEILYCAESCERILTTGTDSRAEYYAHHIARREGFTHFIVRTPQYEEPFAMEMLGLFNVENALVAIAVCCDLGIPYEDIYEGLKSAKVSGRMEVFENKERQVTVIVDYAHNSLSFERLFTSAIQEYSGQKIVSIFGCPGCKAQARRHELAEIAGKYAKKIYITEEDPGEEDISVICGEIAANVKQQGCAFEIIYDREQCVKRAIETAEAGTVILLTGKGRETRQKRGIHYVETLSDVALTKKYL